MNDNKLYVTQPYLPPLEEFERYLRQIWDNKYITNNGPFHQQLEKELCDYLGVKYISLFCNGTIALLVAIKALELKGEIITTPFTFVATTHAIKWNGLNPVFVDIDPLTGNLDPDKIETAITKKTSAILPVHVYGNPCDTSKINKIANQHDLKVIYDVAHAFGVKKDGESILNEGNLSILSFHATKVFNTFEGGAIISQTAEMKKKIDDLKNFGFQDEITIEGIGVNGKMNEVQAAMGLLQLKYIDEVIKKRKQIVQSYRDKLLDIEGISFFTHEENIEHNYSYFPIFINKDKFGKSRDKVYDELKSNNIYARRYFYPLVSQFKPYQKSPSAKTTNLPIAEEMSNQVICLPIYPSFKIEDVDRVVNIILGS